jgi:vancomycin resistance protein YoaR
MPINDYFQEYGPMHRRRLEGELPVDDPAHQRPPRRRLEGELPVDDPAYQRPPRRRRSVRRRTSPLQLGLGLLLFLGVATLILPYGLSLFFVGQAMPGVSVQGVPVAGQNEEAINIALEARYADFMRQPLTLSYAGQTWAPTLEQLGVQLDTAQTTAAALELGRHGDPITRLQDLWRLWRHGLDLAPRLVIDQRQMQDYLLNLAPTIEQAPRDAALSLTTGKIIGTPSATGRQLLVDDNTAEITLALRTLTSQQVTLRTRLLEPTVDDKALQVAEARARKMLSSPLKLTHGERDWVWDQERLAELLAVESVGERLIVQVDEEQLTKAVERLAQFVDSGSAEPRLRFTNDVVQIVQPGQIGWQLRQAEAAQVISTTLSQRQSAARTVALPVDDIQPQISAANLGELGIQELVGEGQSSFAGSAQYRITNIKAGAARMDGVLIAPDEEFSFNTQLGDVNAENGFVEGYAVIGNRTRLEWGGGVCQDSTTVFRAAFWAGLPITERHAHPFYISWYDRFGFGDYGDGAGLDAAIFTGVSDLKFVNDTGNWLLMHAEADEANQILTVRLYGTKPNRTVTTRGPHISNEVAAPATPVYVDDPTRAAGTIYQSDVARNGRDILVERVILEDGFEVRRDSFFTRFKAWPNVFVRGTG